MEYFERLIQHTKKMPCFSCVVRTPCSSIVENGQLIVREPTCPNFVKWQQERDEIVHGTADKIIALAISEVRMEERSARENHRS